MSKCPHCGAEIEYSVKKKKVHCKYCDSDFDVSELKQNKKEASISGQSYLCTQCGATLLSFDETAVTFCSYCGSQNVLEDKLVKQTAPDMIIPFAKTQEECIRNYKRKVRRSLFCPGYMKSDTVVKKFRGIYIPYGIYNFHFSGDCVNKGKRFKRQKGDYAYYTTYDLHLPVDSTCTGINYDLLSKFYDDYSRAIPFHYQDAIPFNSNYLPGFYVDCKDVDSHVYYNDAKEIADGLASKRLGHKLYYRWYSCYYPKLSYLTDGKKTGLFPVYFASIRDKDDQHLYYAIINGQTGAVVADIPVDFKKYLIFSVLVAIPIFYLINSSLMVLPTTLNVFAIVAALIGFLIHRNQLLDSCIREEKNDDKGYQYTITDKEKSKKKSISILSSFLFFLLIFFAPVGFMMFTALLIVLMELFENEVVFGLFLGSFGVTLWLWILSVTKRNIVKDKSVLNIKKNYSIYIKFLPAFVVPILTFILNPVDDLYYYCSAITSLAFTLASFYDLIKAHNLLAARRIPQLNIRGGDESE